MTYAQDLDHVGLHPDNPDGMYSSLMSFFKNPVAFKNADKNWRGARDALTSWDEKGIQQLMWPFHGGKWLDNAPKNDAQIRAVFKIPKNQSTATFLSQIYKFPIGKRYAFKIEEWKQGGGDPFGDAWHAVQSGVGSVVSVANTVKIPGVNFTAALLTGQDPIAALKKDVSNFTDSAAIAKGVVSGDTGPLTKAISDGAKSFGVNLPPQVVSAAVSAAKSGDMTKAGVLAMGPDYVNAWRVATHDGSLFDPALPAPPGLSYAPSAVPAQSTKLDSHPAVAASNRVPIKLALGTTPLTEPLHPETKALISAATGIPIDSPLLNPKKSPWWKIGGAAGGAALGAAVAGPPGALVGGIAGLIAGHLKSK